MLLLDLGKHWVAIKLSTRVIITPNGVSILDQMLAQVLSEGTIHQVSKYVDDIFCAKAGKLSDKLELNKVFSSWNKVVSSFLDKNLADSLLQIAAV